ASPSSPASSPRSPGSCWASTWSAPSTSSMPPTARSWQRTGGSSWWRWGWARCSSPPSGPGASASTGCSAAERARASLFGQRLHRRQRQTLWVRGADAGLVEGVADPPPEFALGRPLHVGVGDGRHAQRPRVGLERVDALELRAGDEVRLDGLLRGGRLGGLDGDVAGAVDVGAVGDRDLQEGDAEVLAVVAHTQDVAVAAVPDRPVQVPQRGDAEPDVLDRALGLAQVHPVADAVLVLEQHEQSGQEVPDERLGTEAEGHADDAGGGDEGRHVDPEDGQRLQHNPDQYDKGHDRLEYRADGGHPLGPPFEAPLLGPDVLGRALAVVLLEARGGQSAALVGADRPVGVVLVVGPGLAGLRPGLAFGPPPGQGPAVLGRGGDPVDRAVERPSHHQRQDEVDGDHHGLLDQPLLREVGRGEHVVHRGRDGVHALTLLIRLALRNHRFGGAPHDAGQSSDQSSSGRTRQSSGRSTRPGSYARSEGRSSAPASRRAARAASPSSSLTGLVRSVSTRVARPAPRASRAVSLTQCDSARPTTSTLVIWWAVRISPSVRPESSRPSNPEYAAA